ncbi:MAG: hypothetical protein NC078_12510 [Ruminococcus sp.]|nr:hypothetical protein [Ruminococcus sp.]
MAIKTHGAKENGRYEDGRWTAVIILKVKKEKISELVPIETAARESVIMGFYRFYGESEPTKEETEKTPFAKCPGPFGTITAAAEVFFERHGIFLKKTEWKIIKHDEGFPENIPDHFKKGVMGSLLMGFGGEVFGFAARAARSP